MLAVVFLDSVLLCLCMSAYYYYNCSLTSFVLLHYIIIISCNYGDVKCMYNVIFYCDNVETNKET